MFIFHISCSSISHGKHYLLIYSVLFEGLNSHHSGVSTLRVLPGSLMIYSGDSAEKNVANT